MLMISDESILEARGILVANCVQGGDDASARDVFNEVRRLVAAPVTASRSVLRGARCPEGVSNNKCGMEYRSPQYGGGDRNVDGEELLSTVR